MQFLKFGIVTLAAAGTIWAAVSSYRASGVRTVAYPKGISLRMGSVAARAGAVPSRPRTRRTRTFRGGGLAGGK